MAEEDVRIQIQDNLGQSSDDIFASFDIEPLAGVHCPSAYCDIEDR